VPEGIGWGEATSCYFAWYHMAQEDAIAHTARLDTFTRFQETTDLYVSLIDELVMELELAAEWVEKKKQGDRIDSLIDRAKQIIGDKK